MPSTSLHSTQKCTVLSYKRRDVLLMSSDLFHSAPRHDFAQSDLISVLHVLQSLLSSWRFQQAWARQKTRRWSKITHVLQKWSEVIPFKKDPLIHAPVYFFRGCPSCVRGVNWIVPSCPNLSPSWPASLFPSLQLLRNRSLNSLQGQRDFCSSTRQMNDWISIQHHNTNGTLYISVPSAANIFPKEIRKSVLRKHPLTTLALPSRGKRSLLRGHFLLPAPLADPLFFTADPQNQRRIKWCYVVVNTYFHFQMSYSTG